MPPKCTNAECGDSEEGRQYYPIDENVKAGGQDWTALVGEVLCHQCYTNYRMSGSLGRNLHRMIALAPNAQQRCAYANCKRPKVSKQFYLIDGHCRTGGQDWAELDGRVLCYNCYIHYRKMGRLERAARQPGNVQALDMLCSFEGCQNPLESRQFYLVPEGSTAGGRDWSSLYGRILCNNCYTQFRTRGTCERKVQRRSNTLLASIGLAALSSAEPRIPEKNKTGHKRFASSSSSSSMKSERQAAISASSSKRQRNGSNNGRSTVR